MKKWIVSLLVVVLLFIIVNTLAYAKNTYVYNEVVLKTHKDWLFWGTVYGDNLENDRYLSLRLTPQRPLDILSSQTLDFGVTVREFQYTEWDEKAKRSLDRETQFLELFFAPELDLNWRWFNLRLRDEFRIDFEGEPQDNLVLGQIRCYPHKLIQADCSYSTFHAWDMGNIRLEGTSSELRLRLGTALFQIIEPGIQASYAYYRSTEDVWESQYRPKNIGFYARLINLPYGLWGEISWEKLKVKERDIRINQILPKFTQTRVLIAFGLSQDRKKFMRR